MPGLAKKQIPKKQKKNHAISPEQSSAVEKKRPVGRGVKLKNEASGHQRPWTHWGNDE